MPNGSKSLRIALGHVVATDRSDRFQARNSGNGKRDGADKSEPRQCKRQFVSTDDAGHATSELSRIARLDAVIQNVERVVRLRDKRWFGSRGFEVLCQDFQKCGDPACVFRSIGDVARFRWIVIEIEQPDRVLG